MGTGIDILIEYYPYFYKSNINPSGFSDLVVSDNDLYAVGGERLLHFDISLAADPNFINEFNNGEIIHAISAKDNVIYLSQDSGIRIIKRESSSRLREIGIIKLDQLGGVATAIQQVDDTLWLLLPEQHQVVAVELNSGVYQLTKRVDLIDSAGYTFISKDIFVLNNLFFV